MLPGGISLEPGEVLLKRRTMRMADPPVVPAAPFTESHIILTNRRMILLGEKHHEYKIFSIPLSDISRVDIKSFFGAGFVKMFAGTIVVIEYWEQGKIKILRVGVEDGESMVQAIEEARQGSVSVTPPPPSKPDQIAAFYCTECGSRLEPGAKFCTKCGKTAELP